MVVPILRAAHELGKDREDGDGLDGHLLAHERKCWADINVVGGCARGLRRGHSREGPFWKGRICRVEGVGIGLVNGNVDLREAVEVWL